VIHFAAESHVDNSIESPEIFLDTNIKGTFNLLEACRNHGKSGIRFHHISTDEVYGSLDNDTDLFREDTPYNPNSPYSVSKAASDFLVRSYSHTYGLDVVITNCSNNYGPKQHKEKLIPKTITNAIAGKKIPVYGNGSNIRDWLYVEDHCEAIDLVFHRGVSGESYNIGSNNERANNQIVNEICEMLDRKVPKDRSYKEQIVYVEDRKGHDKRYGIDASKIKSHLGWRPKTEFTKGLESTINWYLKTN
jgi:dTDP-glucose 4,6-dehydratase